MIKEIELKEIKKEIDQQAISGSESLIRVQKDHPIKIKKRISGVLTKRDVLACQWICEQGVMTVDQLWRSIWWSNESKGPRYAYDRILFLERSGFLERVKSNHSLKTYFKTTPLAHDLVSEETENLVPRSSPKLHEIPHMDGLTELRIAVQRSARSQIWKTDRVLILDPKFPKDRFYGHIPDTLWKTGSGKLIALEYERTKKGIPRVRPKVEAYSREMTRSDRVMDLVLWIGTPSTIKDLEEVLKTHSMHKLRTMNQFLKELSEGQEESRSSDCKET